MMKPEGLEQMKELLTCPVCQDILEEPRQLSCGHSLCLGCLNAMRQHREGYQPFSCPSCRRPFGPLIGFHKSYTLQSIVEDFQATERQAEEKRLTDGSTQTVPVVEPTNYWPYAKVLILPLAITLFSVVYAVYVHVENQALTKIVQRQRTVLHNYNPHRTNLTLDKATVNPFLVVSPDLLTVERVWQQQAYPPHPARFTAAPQVLSSQCVFSGRHSWELEAEGYWNIAVVYTSISRKTSYDVFGETHESWSLKHNGRGQLHVLHNGAVKRLSKPLRQKRIGVVVDFHEGFIVFSEVGTSLNQLHTFKVHLEQPVCLGLGLSKPEMNSRISIKNFLI